VPESVVLLKGVGAGTVDADARQCMKQFKILIVAGTRPEAIKLAPLYHAFSSCGLFQVAFCSTGQHREMLEQVLGLFRIRPDFELDIMQPGQTLDMIVSRILDRLGPVMDNAEPDLVFVQGDTTTAFAGALSAYHRKIPVCHVEAGLRTGNRYSPFPEEMNRLLVSRLATFHFAPTDRAVANLRTEGVTTNVYQVGNTAIDALRLVLKLIADSGVEPRIANKIVGDPGTLVLVTQHRRENQGEGLRRICTALARFADGFPKTTIVFPVHLNPIVHDTVHAILGKQRNVLLTDPLEYDEIAWCMQKSRFVVTDSGGIQEEAPALGIPVIVTREVTERQEGVEAGTAVLSGTDPVRLFALMTTLMTDGAMYTSMAQAVNPYGDGHTSERILTIITRLHAR
jgi:UDP-N-acetylglucosamine 2-epimerase (non-hydrolysing)